MRQVELLIESWPLIAPFVITGYTWMHCDVLVVTITENGVTGRGEATVMHRMRRSVPRLEATKTLLTK